MYTQQDLNNNKITVNQYRVNHGLEPIHGLGNAFSKYKGNPSHVIKIIQKGM